MNTRLIALTILASAAFAEAAPSADPFAKRPPMTTIEDVEKKLRPLVVDAFPDAEIVVSEDQFVAKVSTMTFTVHSVDKGIISEHVHETEGPRHDGFILSVRYSSGAYGGPAMVPQHIREPYWMSLINEMYDVQEESNLWFSYQYGSQVDNVFDAKLRKVIGDGQYSSQQPGRSPSRERKSRFFTVPAER